MTRRDLLAAAAALTFGSRLTLGQDDPPSLPTATLGKTGRVLPRLGLGCYPLGNLAKEDDAIALLHRAFDLGVRYLDTAPSYGAGRSEQRVGKALESWLKSHPDVKRADFYLATKTLHRDGEGATRELEQSLLNLRSDYADAVQCHEVHDDWEGLFAKSAVLESLEKARDQRLIRHTGITGHRNPAYVLSAIRRHPPKPDGSGFVTALVPVNPIDVQHQSFVRGFLQPAADLGVATIAMKIFGGGFLLHEKSPQGDPLFTAPTLLRYALAQPGVHIAVPGCDKQDQLETDHAAVAGFTPPAREWLAEEERKAPRHQGKTTEWYKEAD